VATTKPLEFAKCNYCLIGPRPCRSIQLRATRREDWQYPIMACDECRRYLQEGGIGRWRYTPRKEVNDATR